MMSKMKRGFTQHHLRGFKEFKKRICLIVDGAGFTLIELLVVIAIIGVLAGSLIAIINPTAQFQKANDARRKTDLNQIQKGLDLYYQDNGHYPASISFQITNSDGSIVDWGTPWPPYMGTLPGDPNSSKHYVYNSDGQTYYLYASLDRGTTDPQACNGGSVCASIASNQNACGDICNYGVSTSNADIALASILSTDQTPPASNTPVPTSTPVPISTPTPFSCGTSTVTFTYKGSQVTYGTVLHNTQCWLDRNLGASGVATAYNDSAAYGDLFQWGRLDDGHQTRTSSKTTTLSGTDNPGNSNFIYGMGIPYDWRSPQNNNLWQGVSGTNNPCPAGWRIPTSTELDTERASWSSQNYNGAYASPLKFTAAGYRFYGGNASLNDVGNVGYYWSSTSNAYAYILYFNGNVYGAGGATSSRASGSSVRCVLLPSTPTSTPTPTPTPVVYAGEWSNMNQTCANYCTSTGGRPCIRTIDIGTNGASVGGFCSSSGTQTCNYVYAGRICCQCQGAPPSVAGPNSPGTMADDSSRGSVAWVNPNNAKVSDNMYATYTGSNQTSHNLNATNFGFTIPTNATINGIIVEIELKISSGTDNLNAVNLIKGGVIAGSNLSTYTSIYTTTDSYVTYGSSSNLWGLSLIPDDINASNFGVAINNFLVGQTTSVDHIRIKVSYTLPPSPTPTPTPILKNNGQSCSIGTECTSGNCVDSTCCSTASCSACNTCGSGSCAALADTAWDANLYSCSGSDKRCYSGSCITCGGWMNAGYCWYNSGLGMTCNNACASRGGVHGGTCDWVNDPADCSTCLHWYPAMSCTGPLSVGPAMIQPSYCYYHNDGSNNCAAGPFSSWSFQCACSY